MIGNLLPIVGYSREGNCNPSEDLYSPMLDVTSTFLARGHPDNVDAIASFDCDEDSYRIRFRRSRTIGCGDVFSTNPKFEIRSYFSGLWLLFKSISSS